MTAPKISYCMTAQHYTAAAAARCRRRAAHPSLLARPPPRHPPASLRARARPRVLLSPPSFPAAMAVAMDMIADILQGPAPVLALAVLGLFISLGLYTSDPRVVVPLSLIGFALAAQAILWAVVAFVLPSVGPVVAAALPLWVVESVPAAVTREVFFCFSFAFILSAEVFIFFLRYRTKRQLRLVFSSEGGAPAPQTVVGALGVLSARLSAGFVSVDRQLAELRAHVDELKELIEAQRA